MFIRFSSGGDWDQTSRSRPEKHFFDQANQFWDSADNILDHRYDFRPHLFTLRDSVPVARAVKEVMFTSGRACNSKFSTRRAIRTAPSLIWSIWLASALAFTGDLISGPGQIWEIYSLQKRFPGMRGDYWGFGGAVEEVKSSLDRVLQYKPDLLIPSHGVVMTDPVSAVNQLKQNLDALMENFLTTAAWRIYFDGIYPKDKPPMFPPLPKVTYPKLDSRHRLDNQGHRG